LLVYDSTPTIVVQDSVLADDLCQYIITFTKKARLKPNLIASNGKDIRDELRTSSGIGVDFGENEVIDSIYKSMSEMCHLPISHAEPMSIQRYRPGEEYKPHWDAFLHDEDLPKSVRLEECGNRAVTVIGCLNDSDAATVFPHLGFGIQSMQGRVIMFGNLDEDKEPHPLSMHMGTTPREGEKWIFTLWFREKPFMETKKTLSKKKSEKKSTERHFNPEKHSESVMKKAKDIMKERGSMPL